MAMRLRTRLEDIRPDLLDDVLVLAEELSIGGAARRVPRSPSSVSRRLEHLERALGARLFDRTTRRLQLSEFGSAVIPQIATLRRGAAVPDRATRA